MTVSRHQRDDRLRFRITAWPGVVVPPPPRQPDGPYRLDEEHEVLIPIDGANRPKPIASGEIYLDLARVDLDDPHSILDFANTYGRLGIGEATIFGEPRSFHIPDGGEDELRASRVRAGKALVQRWKNSGVKTEETGFHDFEIETLTEFRHGARLIRDALTAWRFIRGDLRPEDVQWESAHLSGSTSRSVRPTVDDFLTELFDYGLMPFHPGITFLDSDELDYPDDDRRFRVEPGSGAARQGLDLFPICCLELLNHMVEEAEYHLCQNERCGRMFVRQEGRATYGQRRRTGVIYCSASCARAQAQRAYRRRRTEEASPEPRRQVRPRR